MHRVMRASALALGLSMAGALAHAQPAVGTYIDASGARQQGMGASPLPLGASGVAAVTATISSAAASGSFTPLAGRTFHVQITGAAVAICPLERQLDSSTWVPITVTANGITTTLYQWNFSGSASVSEDVVESQAAVPYRVDCGAQLGSFTSGSLAVRVSQ